MRRWWFIVPLSLIALVACVILVLQAGIGLWPQSAVSKPRIYAYRDWQSVGVYVQEGDMVHIRARGTWLYTPEEYHGPEGHARYPAPAFYPIPNVAGGMLIGRVGDAEDGGELFLVGRGRSIYVDHPGLLYLRINDDILSDNEGYVTVEVGVTHPEED